MGRHGCLVCRREMNSCLLLTKTTPSEQARICQAVIHSTQAAIGPERYRPVRNEALGKPRMPRRGGGGIAPLRSGECGGQKRRLMAGEIGRRSG